jgi:hypothetical protein
LYPWTFCIYGRFVERTFCREGRYVEGRFVDGRFVEGHFVQVRFILVLGKIPREETVLFRANFFLRLFEKNGFLFKISCNSRTFYLYFS